MRPSAIIYSIEHGNLLIAKRYHAGGLNMVPLRTDGSKRPTIRWEQWTHEVYPWFECQQHFSSRGLPNGIGIVCGTTSGNSEVMDFDRECSTVFPRWSQLVEAKFPGLATL